MFGSLRTRLIAAFALVILLALVLVSSAATLLVAEYQSQREIDRLQELVLPIAYQVRALELQGATHEDIADHLERQAADLGLRIAVIDPEGTVIQDTAGRSLGMTVSLPESTARSRVVYRATFRGPEGEVVFFAAPVRLPFGPSRDRVEQLSQRQHPNYVAVMAPIESLGTAWSELLPRVAGAALISLLVSVAVALILSASISRPLARMTRAAESMRSGDFEQEIPSRGRDEIARLASSFNEMAREVARSQRVMRDLLANVSHDLRTPLTSIQGFSQAMDDGTLKSPGDYAEAGRIINEEAARMQRLVEDLLYLSRIESGQLALAQESVPLAELVEMCAQRHLRRGLPRGIDLDTSISARPVILGDAGRLEQVLENLLENALRHTPAGGRITLSLAQSGSESLLKVHNTGSYIPPQEIPRIFERFYQVDKARTASAQGSGLGLAIAHEILEAHQGRLSASSSPDAGTTFEIRLPLTPIQTAPRILPELQRGRARLGAQV